MNYGLKWIWLLSLPLSMYAHTLLLNVIDNEDNTIDIEAAFSTGESAEGALIKLQSLVSGEILYQKRLPQDSELTVSIPKEPYKIILDGGPGHQMYKKGIPPQEGFVQKKPASKKSASKKTDKTKQEKVSAMLFSKHLAVNVSIVLSFILLLATLLVSIKNTNKILLQIKESR